MFNLYKNLHLQIFYCLMSRLEKFLFLPIVVGIIVLGACSSNVWDEVPSPITSFVEQYYPEAGSVLTIRPTTAIR